MFGTNIDKIEYVEFEGDFLTWIIFETSLPIVLLVIVIPVVVLPPSWNVTAAISTIPKHLAAATRRAHFDSVMLSI